MITNFNKAISLKNLSCEEAINKFASILFNHKKYYPILPSILIAQFILETNYGQSELIQNANNCFGLKENLSGNNWADSAWDKISVYNKMTKEQYCINKHDILYENFRKYDCIEKCIDDYIAYLLNAKNGTSLRYKGIDNCKDYVRVAMLIKKGGYATDFNYSYLLIDIIKKWGLTKFDNYV